MLILAGTNEQCGAQHAELLLRDVGARPGWCARRPGLTQPTVQLLQQDESVIWSVRGAARFDDLLDGCDDELAVFMRKRARFDRENLDGPGDTTR